MQQKQTFNSASKGQIISLDVVVALVIFATALAAVIYIESSLSNAAADAEEFRRTQNRLIELSDQLVMSTGEPAFWYESAKIKSVGLAYRDHRLSNRKLVALNNMSHQSLRGNLSVGANNVFIQLLTVGGGGNCTVSSTNITAGLVPSNPRERTSMDRLVMTEDLRNCTLRVTLWRASL